MLRAPLVPETIFVLSFMEDKENMLFKLFPGF